MKTKTLHREENNSYSYNKSNQPFPEPLQDKVSPPTSKIDLPNCSDLFILKKEEVLVDDQIRLHLDGYRKVERLIIVNFYTGGSAYRKGIMDAIYRGYNPLNP